MVKLTDRKIKWIIREKDIRSTGDIATHQYFTFASSNDTKLRAYLNERLTREEALNANTPVISPDLLYHYGRGKNSTKKFLPTVRVSDAIRNALRPRFAWKPHVFRSYFDTQQLIAESLNLVFSGMSYRNVARHLKLTYGRDWSHVAILKWVYKYSEMMQAYVDTLKPELGTVWHVDEMMLNVKNTKKMPGKGNYDWCWNMLDSQTRFVLASELSKRRGIVNARNAIVAGNENANGAQPSYVVTDCPKLVLERSHLASKLQSLCLLLFVVQRLLLLKIILLHQARG